MNESRSRADCGPDSPSFRIGIVTGNERIVLDISGGREAIETLIATARRVQDEVLGSGSD